MAKYKISAIVIAGADTHLLPGCLQSLLGQTVPTCEILVAAPAAALNVPPVVDRFRQQAIRLISVPSGTPAAAAREAAAQAQGDYVCCLYPEMWLDPCFIAKEAAALEQNRASAAAAVEQSCQIPPDTVPLGRLLQRSALVRRQDEQITLFIALAGRFQYWEKTIGFLSRQTWPREKIKLVLMDTSQDGSYSKMVRQWLAGSEYPHFRYLSCEVGTKGLADADRTDAKGRPMIDVITDVRVAMARIYNRLRRLVDTQYLLVLEDDVIPPLDICSRLLASMTPDTASVAGPYRHRYEQGYVAWDDEEQLLKGGRGVQEIKGNGFGCVLLRASLLQDAVFTASPECPDFDKAFYRRLNPLFKAKIDWSAESNHLSPIYDLQNPWDALDEEISEDSFDEDYYLRVNPDVRLAVISGHYKSGYEHFTLYGRAERRAVRTLQH